MRFTLEQIESYGLKNYFENNKEKFIKKNVVFSKPTSVPIDNSEMNDVKIEYFTKEYYYISEEYKDEIKKELIPSIKISVNPSDFDKAVQCMKQDIEDEKPVGILYDEYDWITGEKLTGKIQPHEISEAVKDRFFFEDMKDKITEQDVLEILLKMLEEE